MEDNGSYRWSRGTGNPDTAPGKDKGAGNKKIKGIVIAVLVAVVLLWVGSTCWYTVDDKQQAVVTTFGEVTGINGAGVHFKLPFGIQKVHKVDVNVYQKLELGYRTDYNTAEGYKVVDEESKMITGDYNIVNVEFFVEYKISNPERYLFGSNQPEEILRNLIQSQVRNVVGSSQVDSVLTDGKEAIQMRVKELVTEILQEYDIGLTLVDVKIKRFDLPESNENAVYTRMISERNQIAEKYTADGNYEASIIRNDVDKQVNILISNAQAQAAQLEAEGEAEYMRLLAAAYDTADKQDFYSFNLALDALKKSLTGGEKTIILDGDSPLAQLLVNP